MRKWLRYIVGVTFMAVRLNKEERKEKGEDKMVSPCGVQGSNRMGGEKRGEEREGNRKARGKGGAEARRKGGEARRGRKARRGRGTGQGGEREEGESRAQCAPGSLGVRVGWVQGDFVLKGLPADG